MKKKRKSAGKRFKPWGSNVKDMRPMLVRLPEDLRAWLDDTAASFHLSRDAFMRLQLSNIRDGFRAAQVQGSKEQRLFREFEGKLVDATERAVREAVDDAIKRPADSRRGGEAR